MSKMPVEWHEQCLSARQESLRYEQEKLKRLLDSIQRQEESIAFLSQQIEEAKRLRKDGFDADRFMKRST